MGVLSQALVLAFSCKLPASCLRLLFVVLLSMLSGLAMASSDNAARSPTVGEYKVKAAFLYHFAKFIKWPMEARTGELAVCVIGVDPFGSALDALAGKQVGVTLVSVRRLQRPDEMMNCHMVFIGSSERPRLARILASIQDTQILTISDIPSFVKKGGMIMLHMEGSKVRFSINLTAVRSAKLAVSGHLLRLARRVYQNGEESP